MHAQNTCTEMFIKILIITTKNSKQARCPLVSEWINKFWKFHIMKYFSVINSNELLHHTKNLEES